MKTKNETRPNLTGLMVGRISCGKSTFLNLLANEYSKKQGKRVLILDVNGSPAYRQYPLFTDEELKNWKHDHPTRIARFYKSDNVEMFNFVSLVFSNGLIIAEDCNRFIDANPQKPIKALLIDKRMKNLDLFFTFHSLFKVPRFFWDVTDYIILKKTQDIWDDGEARRRYPNPKELKAAFELVNKSKDPYIWRKVETRI